MLLSVITPDKQPGMAKMLKRELDGIHAEIIINNWDDGLKQAKGDFVCFLEKDSAVSEGSIRSSLAVFTDKPAYRKLAMVSPMFDLPSYSITEKAWLSYNNGQTVNLGDKKGVHAARIGMFLGAVIRTSSLRKAKLDLNPKSKTPIDGETYYPLHLSNMLSLYFWENGLRIHLNSEALYQGSENCTYYVSQPFPMSIDPSEKVQKIWQQEMIS